MSFPTRPLLSDFGPLVMLDAGPVRDPERQATAAQWNLMKWQAAGMGLLVPRVIVKLDALNPTPAVLARAEAWNPNGETTGDYAPPTAARTSAGRFTLTYPATVPDMDGEATSVAFSWGFGFIHADPPTVRKSVQVTPVALTPRILTVCVFNASDALEDGNTVWVVAG